MFLNCYSTGYFSFCTAAGSCSALCTTSLSPEQHVWSVVAPLLHVAQAPRQAQQRVRAVCGRRRRREDEQVKIQSGPKLNLFHWNKFDRLGVEGGCAVGAAEYVRQS
jgi:hypothetical protein